MKNVVQDLTSGGLLGVWGKWVKRAKYIYNIQDFNPEQVWQKDMMLKWTLYSTLLLFFRRIRGGGMSTSNFQWRHDGLRWRIKHKKYKDSFECDGRQYYWMTVPELEQDRNVQKKNSDILEYVKERYAAFIGEAVTSTMQKSRRAERLCGR